MTPLGPAFDRIVQTPTIGIAEAASMLGVSRSTLHQAIREERIPAIRFGRVIRIPTRPFIELLEAQGTTTDVGGADGRD